MAGTNLRTYRCGVNWSFNSLFRTAKLSSFPLWRKGTKGSELHTHLLAAVEVWDRTGTSHASRRLQKTYSSFYSILHAPESSTTAVISSGLEWAGQQPLRHWGKWIDAGDPTDSIHLPFVKLLPCERHTAPWFRKLRNENGVWFVLLQRACGGEEVSYQA